MTQEEKQLEVWKPIPNYEEYEVSNLGRVKRLAYDKAVCGGGIQHCNERILSPQTRKFGCCTPVTPVVLPNYTTVDLEECANHFAEWGAEHLRDSTKMIDKSLEEAAEEYIKNGRYLPEAWVVRPAFIAGAEWQYQKDRGEFAKIRAKIWCEGFDAHNEQMLKEAVECDVIVPIYDGNVWSAEIEIPGRYKIGDKVRIVVLKEEE